LLEKGKTRKPLAQPLESVVVAPIAPSVPLTPVVSPPISSGSKPAYMYYNTELDVTLLAEVAETVNYQSYFARIFAKSLSKHYPDVAVTFSGKTILNPHKRTYD
jgi:hypothetical protein